jgi:PAS domain S-box-containing protein
VLDLLPASAIVTTGDGRVLYMNAAALELHGFACAEDALGRRMQEWPDCEFLSADGMPLDPTQMPAARAARGEAVNGQRVQVFLLREGHIRTWEYTARTIAEQSGERRIVLVVSDVTELSRVQREVSARDEWIADVSHDLKNALAALRGYAELLVTDTEAPAEVTRQSSMVLRQALHLQQLTGDLKVTSRIVSGEIPFEMRPTSLYSIVRQLAETVEYFRTTESSVLEFSLPERDVCVPVDEGLFLRALVNITANAFVHNPPGTKVTLSASASESTVAISIADEGSGIDSVVLARIMEVPADGPATGGRSGSGLGLPIARRLIETMGGDLRVESEVGKGTAVLIQLPRCSEPDGSERSV